MKYIIKLKFDSIQLKNIDTNIKNPAFSHGSISTLIRYTPSSRYVTPPPPSFIIFALGEEILFFYALYYSRRLKFIKSYLKTPS